jgi:hypothetical protein
MVMMWLLSNNQIIIGKHFFLFYFENINLFSLKKGLSDGVSGNRHHGLDAYQFADTLILSCLEETDRVNGSSCYTFC